MPRPKTPFKRNPELSESTPQRPLKKPSWFRIRLREGERYQKIDELSKTHGLSTVCKEARCPNIYECWNEGTATFMLMGDTCTRACRFCHVKNGRPNPLDTEEPQKIAHSVKTLGLDYVVLTSVNRDELKDGGSGHFADTVRAIKNVSSKILVEALTPDFRNIQETAIQTMLESGVDVIAHNVETVRRLVSWVRDPRCRHDTSLKFHQISKRLKPTIVTKSSLMLGLGETLEEVVECMQELRDADVDVLTLGQYLQPTVNHHPVVRFVSPDEFKDLENQAGEMGFRYVASGPLVRSSYRAGEFYIKNMLKAKKRERSDEAEIR